MDVSIVRKELHQFINLADDRMVKALYALMLNYLQDDESIVAYSTNGKPLTKADFVAEVRSAYEETKNGKVFTTKTVLNSFEI